MNKFKNISANKVNIVDETEKTSRLFRVVTLGDSLIKAVEDGDLKAVIVLLQDGADPNATNKYGITALSIACRSNQTEIAKELVRRGADVSQNNIKSGYSPLTYVAELGNVDLMRFLLRKKVHPDAGSLSALNLAIEEDEYKIVKMLVNAGADVNRVSISLKMGSVSPLHLAALLGRKEIAKLLLLHGANVNQVIQFKDGRYMTALDCAEWKSREEDSDFRLHLEIDAPNSLEHVVSQAQMLNNYAEIIQALISKGGKRYGELGEDI